MHKFLKEVARGPRASRHLSYDESLEAAALVLDPATTSVEIAAFFTALRMQGETVDEILAFVQQLRNALDATYAGIPGALDCAGPYDGRARSFFATIPVAMVLSAVGVPVILHGSRTLPPKFGVTLLDVMQVLGISVAQDWQSLTEQLQTSGLSCVDTEALCQPLASLRTLREQLGFRTLLNTAEKFINVGHTQYAVAGVFHGTALDTASQIVARLGYKRAMVVQGVDGSEDIPMHRASALCLVENGEIREYRIHPQDYGLETPLVPVSLTQEEQAQGVILTLQGENQGYRNMVILNSAVRLWLVGRVSSVEHGVTLATDVLDSGQAWSVLERVRSRPATS